MLLFRYRLYVEDIQMRVFYAIKGQLISRGLFGILNSPKKGTKKFNFTTDCSVSSVVEF